MKGPIRSLLASFVILASINCPFWAVAESGPGGSGGGDELGMQFVTLAIKAVDEVSGKRGFSKINAADLKSLAGKMVVTVSDEPLFVQTPDGRTQKSIAVNQPKERSVQIDRNRWLLLKSEFQRRAIALHELLSLKGLESTGRYPISSRYLSLHESTPIENVFTPLSVKARSFRINENEVSSDGFAIGWGVPGKMIDFEALDKDEAAVDKFVEKANVQNYLVDIVKNQILLELNAGDDMVDYSLGHRHVGNHFHWNVASLAIENLPWGQAAIAVIENWKWANGISQVVLTKRSSGETKVVSQLVGVQEEIERAIEAKLTESQLEKFRNGARNISLAHQKFTGTFRGLDYFETPFNLVTITSEVPKSQELGVEVTALVQLVMNQGKIEARIVWVTVSDR
jgi:hypothetical protein